MEILPMAKTRLIFIDAIGHVYMYLLLTWEIFESFLVWWATYGLAVPA